MVIKHILSKQILDSKNHPTIEATVILDDDSSFTAASPSGASTGTTEAVELPVEQALTAIQTRLIPALIGKPIENQDALDSIIITLDGTNNKRNIGGNASTAVSMALVKAGAYSHHIPLYSYVQTLTHTPTPQLPIPLFLVIEGGKHGDWATDIQEFMLIPNEHIYKTFHQRFDVCIKVFHTLETLLHEKHYSLTIGFEGAFAPKELTSNEEALELITKAIEESTLTPGKDITIGIDAAASEFYDQDSYILNSEHNTKRTKEEWLQQILAWTKKYPIRSLEDMFDEEDWPMWKTLTSAIGQTHLIVGDDLVTTNTSLIQKAIHEHAINSCIIKVNQIGTITEAIQAILLSKENSLATIVSHRGGETLDDTIADLAVGSASYCKFGGPRKPERMAKYNRLFAIENELEHH